jgi:DNA-directed RNA polymerase subunit RPC12/RpoP
MSIAGHRRRWSAENGPPKPCPYCGSSDTERSAVFGPFHMSEAYVCRACHSPFSRIKWGETPVTAKDTREE